MRFALAGVLFVLSGIAAGDPAVDWTVEKGPVKAVNGVGQPPLIGFPELTMLRYLKDARIPYSRLHDVGGPYGRMTFVDIPNLFRDFEADERDPANYDFAFTDVLVKALVKNGVEPFFRLGVTIENYVGLKTYRIDPPSDFGKWARICEHVIRHYTEGWANGFAYKIGYWEIWNEPENYEAVEENCMWRAPFSEFIRFYGTVAPYLKTKFPHLKIGGYGSCGFYAAVGSDRIRAANSSPRLEYFVTCARQFLSAARDGKWPLDFFSYHSYSAPDEALAQVSFARELLDAYGFAKTETCFNEWLPKPSHDALGTARQAAMIAAELIGLQNGPCDMAMIYDARCSVGNYSPLFNPLTYKPHKAYYAFLAFGELRALGTAVACRSPDRNLRMSAAKGSSGRAVLLANCSDRACVIPDLGIENPQVRLTDDERTWETVALPRELNPNGVLFVCGR